MEFSRQRYWSRLPFPTPGDPPDPGIEPRSPVLAGGFFISAAPGATEIPNSSSRYSVSLKGGGGRLRSVFEVHSPKTGFMKNQVLITGL